MSHDQQTAGLDLPEPSDADRGIDEAVARLAAANADRKPCEPVRDLIGSDSVDRAYRVQERLVAAQIAATGARRVGRKIGLTSKAVQAQLGVDQPDFGTLLSSMVVTQAEPVAAGRLLQPRIEAEIAFVLAADIDDPDPCLKAVSAAVGTAHAALEIVDSRVAGWDITIADTIADNASSGLFVLGQTALSLGEFDPVAVAMSLEEDGRKVSSGTGAACLDNPLLALQWLARVAVGVGDPLRAGEVVLSGALGPMVPVRSGSTYRAVLTGLGTVAAVFAAAEDQPC